MKKLLILIALLSSKSFAQTVNDIPLKDIKSEYVQIVGTGKFLSEKITIELDFGQKSSAWTKKDTQLLDAEGKKVELNSMIDALNFMVANGYEFVQAYVITIPTLGGNQNVYHYLLRKKK